jgi:hypothetical protein
VTPTDCFTDAQIIGVLIVTLICAALLLGAGYWAGSADSRLPRREGPDEEIPDPRKFKPPTRKP